MRYQYLTRKTHPKLFKVLARAVGARSAVRLIKEVPLNAADVEHLPSSFLWTDGACNETSQHKYWKRIHVKWCQLTGNITDSPLDTF